MKKKLAATLSVVLILGLSVLGILAYLTSEDSDVNVMTLGEVEIKQIEQERVEQTDSGKDALQEFTGNDFEKASKPLYPAVYEKMDWSPNWQEWPTGGSSALFTSEMKNVQDKFVFVENTGKSPAYVRTIFAFEQGKLSAEKFDEVIGININATHWSWETVATDVVIKDDKGVESTYVIKVATYIGNAGANGNTHPNGVLVTGETTRPSLLQVMMYNSVTNEDVAAIDGNGDGKYNILAFSQAGQTEGFNDPAEALNTMFYKVDANNHPWVDGIEGPKVPESSETYVPSMTTLPDGTDIKKSVTNVIFGLKKDYPNIVNGGYVTAENDNHTAYYVPNPVRATTTYSVYMLSDEKMYAPADSTGLFRDMTALVEVDLSGLDMSTATTAKYMFRECTKLESIGDVSDWDTSSLTSTRGMFYNCSKLDGLDVSKWDVSNIEDAGWMFYNCQNISELDVADWDTSSFNFSKSMFYNNVKVKELDVENWDMSDVTDTSYMFSYCTALGDIDFSKWDVSNVQYFNNMFKHARAMTTLDLSSWDTSSAVDMNHMFANCGSLKYLDISGFDTSKVTTMAWMFYEIEAEKIYVGDKWSLESIASLDEGVYSHKIATAPLVGGQGTTCRQIMELDSKCVAENGARINATARYMKVDGGSTDPGLLTYK